jgi:hypothetical protein
VAAIVGVPWQDIARRDANAQPDLLAGLNADGHAVGGFQNAAELAANGTWDVIVGEPDNYVAATDPLMVESVDPRSGVNPITGDALAPPGAGYLANPINGHEWTISQRDDLQYACIFELQQPLDCSNAPPPPGCPCYSPGDNPACQAANGQYGQTQIMGKAYPGLRELQLVEALGNRGAVGSVCAAQTDTPTQADFGYGPSVAAIVEMLRPCL